MRHLFFYILVLSFFSANSQTKNFIDHPYIETSGVADTLVSPDRIYLNIIIAERDTKGKVSVEELENKMNNKLKSLGIDTKKYLVLNDLASNYKKYFLKQQDIQKVKAYTLLVTSAEIAGRVIMALEEIDISNVTLERTEYSKVNQLMLNLKSRAVVNAKNQANAMTQPLNQKVLKAIYISDSNTDFSSMLAGRVSGIQIQGAASLKKFENFNPIDIEFEKIKFEARVNVTFSLE